MKRIVLLTCIGSLALVLTALGAQKGKSTHESAKGGARTSHVVSTRSGSHVGHTRISRSVGSRSGSHSVARARTLRSSRVEAARTRTTRIANERPGAVARNRAAISRERSLARANALRTSRNEATRIRSARANTRIARSNLALNRQRNLTMARNVAINRAANARIVNNWRNTRFRGSNYAAFYNYNRRWHDRGWWNNHYSRIVFVLGGWWYWNAGYWSPAWGYDPYAYYPYDGPIYGYGDLAPDRIIVNVQVALQEQGYYAGAIDGDLGPQTRGALAAFQADHGLAVTSAVDRPTLQTLGLA
jgi:Putative peptidoglycan binding domain